MSDLVFDAEQPHRLVVELVQPREDWFGMEVIGEYLPQLVDALSRIKRPIPGSERFVQWYGSHDWQQYGLSRERGVKGLITDYPQHAGLRIMAQKQIEGHRLDVAALVIWTAHSWRQGLDGPVATHPHDAAMYKKRLDGAWRSIRLLSDIALRKVPPVANSLQQFTRIFERELSGAGSRDARQFDDDDDARHLQELFRFFDFYRGGGRLIIKSAGSKLEQGSFQLTGRWCTPEVDEASEVDSPNFKVSATTRALDDLRESDHFKVGNAPEEISEGPLLLSTTDTVSVEQGESLGSAVRKLQHRKVAYRRANSVLPGRWECLNQYELRVVIQSFEAGDWDSHEEIVLVTLLLITGRDLDSVLDARVVKSRDQLPQQLTDPGRIFLIADEQAWASAALKPPHRRQVQRDWRSYLEQTQSHVIFDVPAKFWQLLIPVVSGAATRTHKRSALLFQNRPDSEDLRARVEERLKALRKMNSVRVTVKRLQSQLFNALVQVSADTTEASLVSGRQPPFGQSASIYYHHCSLGTLRASYDQVLTSWARWLSAPAPPLESRQLDLDPARIGSSLALRHDVMHVVVGSLVMQLQEYVQAVVVASELRRFHNLYTAYAHLMLFWASGYRAVRDPIASPYELNLRRRCLIIADKVGDGMGHSRVVFLPELMIRQLESYRAHSAALRERINLIGGGTTLETFLWYLDSDFGLEQATPARLAQEISWTFPWPLNVSRHSLRGYLRERGIAGDLVDAFMGHWGAGAEPWSKLSALDPLAYRNILDPALTEFLKASGFVVLEGLG